ncbi:odorant receptor 30a isoform X1 [Plodia interpunctella]|uniref:odorant receptor 30a isoform X1 n=1 Tax=Plodia interpunctella TaxID=58824 RepID=UPI002367832D|nr:odorant receptor 30a-like isoform X1 [Plodia interpunctella]
MPAHESNDICAPGKYYFMFNLQFLTLVGLWRNDSWPKRWLFFYDIYETTLHILPMIYIVITSIGTYQQRNELTLFLANVDKNLVAVNFITKYIIFMMKRKQLSMLITEIIHSGDNITKKCVKLMSIHVIVVTIFSLSVVTAFCSQAIMNREMIVEAWLPFDTMKNLKQYLTAFQILATMFTPSVLRGIAMQGLICSIIMYLCEQLKELQRRIRSLKFSLENEVQMRNRFKDIIKKHVRLMKYSQTMKVIFNEYFFVQNLAITLELCLNAVMMTVVGLSQKKLLISFLAFLCVALLNAYIYSYLGNELIIQSENIAHAAYDTEWTSWPVDLQKDLLIVIRTAQKPLVISAGGMANMSMQTFAQALYNGYSIFAVLADAVD